MKLDRREALRGLIGIALAPAAQAVPLGGMAAHGLAKVYEWSDVEIFFGGVKLAGFVELKYPGPARRWDR